MPFLEDLILGKRGSDRRQRYAEGSVHLLRPAGDSAGHTRSEVQASLSTFANLQRRAAGEPVAPGPLDGLGEGRWRPCGNLACGKSWMRPWKSREHPVFDGQWACSRVCLAAMVKAALTRETADGNFMDGPEPHHHRIPLGLVMLAQGWITHPQLQRALEAQRTHGSGRIGEWLVSECGLPPERIVRGLGSQWNCPVLSIEGSWPDAMAMALPRVFLEEYGVVPLRLAGKKILYIGFQDSLDASASFALERMTGLRAESGVLPEADFARARETLLRCEFPRQSIASTGDRDGLARAIAETVQHEQPEASRLVRLHRYYWLRVWAKGEPECAAGDLPSSANGVRDYLFTIGERVARPVQDSLRSQTAGEPRRRNVDGDPVFGTDARGAGDAIREPTKMQFDAKTAFENGELPFDEGGDIDLPTSAVPPSLNAESTSESAVMTEHDPAGRLPAGARAEYAGSQAAFVESDTVYVTEQNPLQHFLARREAWFDEVEFPAKGHRQVTKQVRRYDEDARYDSAEPNPEVMPRRASIHYMQGADLQQLNRAEFDAELETIDGEYLPGEEMSGELTGPVAGSPSSIWNRFGLPRTLRLSSRDRESGPPSGPGRVK